ncbi:TetR/AcrR family transcriptional regulator [Salipaludibacillus sp. HK11]|uniref:TetR/AcrR family transcriptional regulator n=1 Tax=Salipaludibacillus sp. HK11 TaxID=3394320 RepID=UPI0039FCA1D3
MQNHPERREQLMKIALELYATNGYPATKVSSIVKRAGVAQGTFYWHFKSKKDIALAILKEGELALLQVIQEGYRKDVGTIDEMIASSTSLMTHLFTFAKEERYLMTLLFLTGHDADEEIIDLISKINKDLEDAFSRNIHRAQELGMLKSKSTEDLRASMLTSLVKGMMQRWLFHSDETTDSIHVMTPQTIAKEIVDFEFFGLLGKRID